MKIVIINHHAILPDIPGGHRHFELGKRLVKSGFNVEIWASNYIHYHYKDFVSVNKVATLNREGVVFRLFKTRPKYRNNGLFRLLNMFSFYWKVINFKAFEERPDIVIGSSVHPLSWTAAEKIAKKYRAHYYSEIRDLWPETLVQIGNISRRHPIVLFFSILEKRMLKKAEKIFVVFPNIKLFSMKYKVNLKKIFYLPNGVSLSDFELNKKNMVPLEIEKVLKNSYSIVYLGSFGAANSVEFLLDVARFFANKPEFELIKFLLIGEGPEKKRLISECKTKKIDNVLFFNAVEKKAVASILSKAKVNIITMMETSLYDYGISLNKLYECLAAGRPILFSGKVYDDVVMETGCGFSVPPQEVEITIEHIMKLFRMSEDDLREMGSKGHNLVKNRFEYDIISDNLKKVLLS